MSRLRSIKILAFEIQPPVQMKKITVAYINLSFERFKFKLKV